MDRRVFNLALGLSAIGLQVAALVAVVRWLGQTDWLFGHYQGPAFLVAVARWGAAFGVGTAVIWLVASWRSARANVAIGLVLLLLALPSALVLLGWAADATRKPRNWWEEPANFRKPPDDSEQKPDREQQPGSARTKGPG